MIPAVNARWIAVVVLVAAATTVAEDAPSGVKEAPRPLDPAVATLVTQLGYEAAPHEVADRLTRLLARSDQQFIVAEADGRLLGWVHVELAVYVESGTFAVIGCLVVDGPQRVCREGPVFAADEIRWEGWV